MNEQPTAGHAQLGFDLGDSFVAGSYEPDRDEIRRELQQILVEAKAATPEGPWGAQTLKYHKIVFPQMARWLPDLERDNLCRELDREIDRICRNRTV